MKRAALFLVSFVLIFCNGAFSQQVLPDSVVKQRAIRFDSIATAHRARNRFDSSLFYHRKALANYRKVGDFSSATVSLLAIAEIFDRQRKEKEALEFYRSSIISATRSGDLTLRVKVYDRAISAFRKADKFQEAFYYQSAKIQLRDSLENVVARQRTQEKESLSSELERTRSQQSQQIGALQDQLEQAENETEQLNEAFTRYKNISFGVGAALVMLAVALALNQAFLLRKMARQRKSDELRQQERLVLAQHIKNDLAEGVGKITQYAQRVQDTPTGNEIHRGVGLIQYTTFRLMDDVRDVVWNVRVTDSSLRELIQDINKYGETFFEDQSMEMVSQSPEKVPDFPVGKLTYRSVFNVVKVIFQEIARQSKAMNVYVSFSMTEDRFSIAIMEDGLGLHYDPDDKEDWYLKLKAKLLPVGGLLNVTREDPGTRLHIDVRLNVPKKIKQRKV